MLDKAVVEEVVDRYHVKVRIPIYNLIKGAANATPTDQLYVASVCVDAGNYPALVVGDVVFVSYEDEQVSEPVIIGCLYRKEGTQSTTNIVANSAKINIDCELPENTSIGNITATDISNLFGTTGNIQKQIDSTVEQLNNLHTINGDLEVTGNLTVSNSLTVANNKVITEAESPFKFGITSEGKYGYIKEGADTVTPFSDGNIELISTLYGTGTKTTYTFKNDYKSVLIHFIQGDSDNNNDNIMKVSDTDLGSYSASVIGASEDEWDTIISDAGAIVNPTYCSSKDKGATMYGGASSYYYHHKLHYKENVKSGDVIYLYNSHSTDTNYILLFGTRY